MAFAGLDFGSSNCALGVSAPQGVQLLSLPDHGNYMPSTLFAPHSDMISAWLYRALKQQGSEQAYQSARGHALDHSLRMAKELQYDGYGEQLYFGAHALKHYLEDPADCYYIRSPKSFLGASGLPERQQQRFEDIAAAMMLHLKQQAEAVYQQNIERVVIGRPVNFQGLNSEKSNAQAINILRNAARFVGFQDVEFLFEPMAAGLAYQTQLNEEQKVLVVDIGGGTSDVSFVKMGPDYLKRFKHQDLVLGYTGQRIGGNDFDIALNIEALMPALGSKVEINGRSVPQRPFVEAASVNNFPAQQQFYASETAQLIAQLIKESNDATLQGLAKLQRQRASFQLSANAESAKIALSQGEQTQVDLGYLRNDVSVNVSLAQYRSSAAKLLGQIIHLCDEVVTQAQCQPDVLFLTGGSANSPLIRHALEQRFSCPVVCGDNFGSVTTGLSLWAEHIFS